MENQSLHQQPENVRKNNQNKINHCIAIVLSIIFIIVAYGAGSTGTGCEGYYTYVLFTKIFFYFYVFFILYGFIAKIIGKLSQNSKLKSFSLKPFIIWPVITVIIYIPSVFSMVETCMISQ